MRTKIICFLVCLLFLVLGSGPLAQSGIDYCPLHPNDLSIVSPAPEMWSPSSPRAYTVPRKQVLLEIATATW